MTFPEPSTPSRATVPAVPVFLLTLCLALLMTACAPVAAPAAPAAPAETSTESPAVAEPVVAEPADADGALVIYSGRNENLVGPLIEQFQTDTGIQVEVRYGGTSEMAATILEEGANSPADVFYGQDAGALGALSQAGRLAPLPADVLELVDGRFRSTDGDWIGASGRARVLVYNRDLADEAELPADVWGLTEARWQGKIGWAPTNGSFQAFVTALRVLEGEDQARAWLEAMIANGVQSFANNTSIVEATGRGEIEAGLVNHYYLLQFLAEQGESFAARNHFFPTATAGAMINVAGAGVINNTDHPQAAQTFLAYLLSPSAQQYFADQTNEYPLIPGVSLNPILPPLEELVTPSLDLADLEDLQGTLELLQDVGALE